MKKIVFLSGALLAAVASIGATLQAVDISSSNTGLSGVLAIANGGTAGTTIASARSSLAIDQRSTFSNAAYAMLSTDYLVVQTGSMSAARAVTLVAASTMNAGRKVIIADESGSVTATNLIQVAPTGADTINGSNTTQSAVNCAYCYVELEADGVSKWTAIRVSVGSALSAGGVLQASQFPALTGDVTTTAGSLATTIANSAVTNAKMANSATTVAGQTCTLGSTCGLSSLTNSLSGDVAMNNTANYFSGPTVAQGTTGTWWAAGTVTVRDTGASAIIFCKLWDGTTVIASTSIAVPSANADFPVGLSGFLASPAGNIRIDCRDISNTTGVIKNSATGLSKDSTVSAMRIN